MIRKSKDNSSKKEIFTIPNEAGEIASQSRDDRQTQGVENQTLEVLGVTDARPFDLKMSPIGEIANGKADENMIIMAPDNKDIAPEGEENSLTEISLVGDTGVLPENLSPDPAPISEDGNAELPLDRPETSLERPDLNLHRNASEPFFQNLQTPQNSQPKPRTPNSKSSQTLEVIPDAQPQTQTKPKPFRPEDFARAHLSSPDPTP